MKEAELNFRHLLAAKMKGRWLMSWHEDREISPGIPDLHYVMMDDFNDYRVGWLELKAVDEELSSKVKIKIEPSQHQYITRWGNHTPIYFLIQVGKFVHLVDSQWHKEIPGMVETSALCGISMCWFRQDDIGTKLPTLLKSITRIQKHGTL